MTSWWLDLKSGLRMLVQSPGLALMLSVLALFSAGIYALLSFTVSQRKKGIGIRTTLGVVRALGLEWEAGGNLLAWSGAIVLPGVALLMMSVGAVTTAAGSAANLHASCKFRLKRDVALGLI